MKNLLLIGTLLLSINLFAGNEKGNGGDICENKIQNIKNDIESWLLNGEFKGIKLPAGLSEEVYKNGMLEAVKKSLLSCTNDKVKIGNAEKTCKNFDDKRETRIVCNFDRIMKTNDEELYRLIHHEFAGVAGFELNKGEETSNYEISNGINPFLKKEIVLKLGVKKANIVYAEYCLSVNYGYNNDLYQVGCGTKGKKIFYDGPSFLGKSRAEVVKDRDFLLNNLKFAKIGSIAKIFDLYSNSQEKPNEVIVIETSKRINWRDQVVGLHNRVISSFGHNMQIIDDLNGSKTAEYLELAGAKSIVVQFNIHDRTYTVYIR